MAEIGIWLRKKQSDQTKCKSKSTKLYGNRLDYLIFVS